MKLLIAVMSCEQNEQASNAIRNTWGRDSKVPVKFFRGQPARKAFPRKAAADEIILPVDDSYEALIHKVHATFRWAKANGYSAVAKVDDDVYLHVDRLLASGLLSFDHVGQRVQQTRYVEGDVRCPKGFIAGPAYLVGERALPLLCNTPIPASYRSDDGWVTNVVQAAGLKSVHDSRFAFMRRVYQDPIVFAPTPDNSIIAAGEFLTLANGRSELVTVHRRMLGVE